MACVRYISSWNVAHMSVLGFICTLSAEIFSLMCSSGWSLYQIGVMIQVGFNAKGYIMIGVVPYDSVPIRDSAAKSSLPMSSHQEIDFFISIFLEWSNEFIQDRSIDENKINGPNRSLDRSFRKILLNNPVYAKHCEKRAFTPQVLSHCSITLIHRPIIWKSIGTNIPILLGVEVRCKSNWHSYARSNLSFVIPFNSALILNFKLENTINKTHLIWNAHGCFGCLTTQNFTSSPPVSTPPPRKSLWGKY